MNRTVLKRRCSSWIVALSLKSGTTIDNCGGVGALRDMAETPSGRVAEIVPDQNDAFVVEKRSGFHAAEQGQLALTGFEKPRARLHQLVVDIPGMHHQLGHAI